MLSHTEITSAGEQFLIGGIPSLHSPLNTRPSTAPKAVPSPLIFERINQHSLIGYLNKAPVCWLYRGVHYGQAENKDLMSVYVDVAFLSTVKRSRFIDTNTFEEPSLTPVMGIHALYELLESQAKAFLRDHFAGVKHVR
jgi:hypothetical protein